MASSIIHMAVASEINKVLKHDNDKILIGSIAPDLSKYVNISKETSHFISDNTDNIPNIDSFLIKYRDKLSDDFVLGYFIHLYTDYLWFKYFIPEFLKHDYITKIDGTVVKCNGDMLSLYIYNDYTYLNTQLIDEYNMNLDIFYNEPPKLDNIIHEIPMDKINIILNEVSVIIENSKKRKDLIFDIDNINNFIKMSVELTISKLKELNIL